jgi:hypothetical protein
VFVRFLQVFGLILFYMLVLAAILFLVILWAGDDATLILGMTLVMLVLSIAAFIPYLDWVTKRVFRFPGEGDAVSGAELRAAILAINQFDVPVMVEDREDRLVATWKYVDAPRRVLSGRHLGLRDREGVGHQGQLSPGQDL